jgi:sulfide:quinone oxidoreductase
VFDRFSPKGFEVVYVGAFETPVSCDAWRQAFDLPFPVVADEDGALFRKLTNGWVPCNLLVAPDGTVLFAEDDFDEDGYATAIAGIYEQTETPPPSADTTARRRGPSEAARIVILGGGVGGVVAAHHLRRRLPDQHRIVVIDRSAHHLYSSSLLWLMVGERSEEQIRRPLTALSERGIEYHRGEVEAIDLSRRVVRTPSDAFDFDYLIVSLGAEHAPQTIAGFDTMAHDLYSVEGCKGIHRALEAFEGGTIGVLVPSMPFKCPAAPYEAAFLIDAFCRKKGVRDATQIHLFTPEHQPMPVAGVELGNAVTQMLEARGIGYNPLFTFDSLRPDDGESHSGEPHSGEIVASDGRAERVDLLLAVPPHRAPQVIRDSGLLGVSGWVHVDPHTLRTEHEGVFAIGDVTTIKLPDGKALPKAGVFAHYEAKVVAEQIAAEVRGRSSRASFDGKGYCFIELGNGKAGFAGGRFYAEPEPKVRMRRPGRLWHWGKVAFETWWLRHWF